MTTTWTLGFLGWEFIYGNCTYLRMLMKTFLEKQKTRLPCSYVVDQVVPISGMAIGRLEG